MSLRQSVAVSILKGRFFCLVRKWRFSVTRTSAPVHSVYAAIRASAGLSPLFSYLAPSSKGMRNSSSMLVSWMIKRINSLKSSPVRWFCTSLIMKRDVLKLLISEVSTNVSIRSLDDSFLKFPNAKMYSLESRTRSKLFLPEFFTCFSKCFNNSILTHAKYWGGILSSQFAYSFQTLFRLFFAGFNVFFHNYSPCLKFTVIKSRCQGDPMEMLMR